ncbi:MAG: helix-turn-helix domain-containing protein [Nitrosomonas sp.]
MGLQAPWTRAQSCFTLLFEAFALALIKREMPVTRVAQILGVPPSAFGQSWITGLATAGVIHDTEGKGKLCMQSVAWHLIKKGVSPEQIEKLSMGLSPCIYCRRGESFPKASITFDHFHVVKLLFDC